MFIYDKNLKLPSSQQRLSTLMVEVFCPYSYGRPARCSGSIKMFNRLSTTCSGSSKEHFWKGAKFAGSVGHLPLDPAGALPPDHRYRLVLRTRHDAPNH